MKQSGRGSGRFGGQGYVAGRGRGRNNGGRDGGYGGYGGRGRGSGRGFGGGRGRGVDSGRGGYQARGQGGSYRGACGPGGRAFPGCGPPPIQPQLYNSIGTMSCSRFIASVLAPCTPANLVEAVTQQEAMWTASWRQAATLDGTSMETLLSALARLPSSASIPPPRLLDVIAVVSEFLQYSSDGNNALRTGLSVEEAKLSAVEIVEKVFQRLTKFTWHDARDDVHSALGDMLSDADKLLEPRYATHRKARERVMLLFCELDKPWIIRTSAIISAGREEVAGEVGTTTISQWQRPTVAWLLDWNNFQPLKLPAMKVPNGHGEGVYETSEEYFDTTIKVWTGMTFIDGHNALLPHCTVTTKNKICHQPLWPMHARGYANYECRTRGCSRLVEYVCANRNHQVGLCKPCGLDRQQKLRGPPSDRASTHIYDATLRRVCYDGKLYLVDFASRRPPGSAVHWKTTRRLSSPNLVGIVLLSNRGGSLKLSDEIYWAKVALHGQPQDEFVEREDGRLALELLEYSVDETGNPLLAREVESGASVAIIDCQTFVPEFVPVLKALERQREMPMPFQSGALVNLKRVRGRHDEEGDDIVAVDSPDLVVTSAEVREDVDEIDDRAVIGRAEDSPYFSKKQTTSSLIHMLVERSMLDPIVQIRRDQRVANLLCQALTCLVTQATLDEGQLDSFINALLHPVHCTQGPPGTGKSYLGVVVVRALLVIRKMWIRVSPSVGEPPILVLSYKNHAIDEFLMDLVKAEGSVDSATLVRLGGGCTEPSLRRFQESNVIASTREVTDLERALDDLHQLASKVRNLRKSFGAIYEAHVLVKDSSEDHGESCSPNDTRDRNRIISQAAAELATAAATIIGVSQSIQEKTKSSDLCEMNDDGTTKSEPMDTTGIVSAAEMYVEKKAILSIEDVVVLYHGVCHYDSLIDPEEVLFKWMSGFIPSPPCAYEKEDCANTVEQSGTFCRQHQCHFSSRSVSFENGYSCERSVALHQGFCLVHMCSVERCRAPVFQENEVLCSAHACFVCIREKLNILPAADAPPRNTCLGHPLCWATSNGVQCENVVMSPDSSYCQEHSGVTCRGKSSGVACTNLAISRTTPFCYAHVSQSLNNANGKSLPVGTATVDPNKCAAKTSKGKPCKGTPLVGMIYCVNHVAKGVQNPSATMQNQAHFVRLDAQRSPVTDDNGADVVVAVKLSDSTETNEFVDQFADKKAVVEGNEQVECGPDHEDIDAGSDASGSIVDLAIDQALSDFEEEFDEPDHIQHLRDVDEVETGAGEEDEFLFDDGDDEGYEDPIGEEVPEHANVPVGMWHWDMSLDARWQAIRLLLSSWDPLAQQLIQAIRQKFEETKRHLHEERSRAKIKLYEGKAVIGGTITGCVTRLEAIRATKPFAILVEEASEVLEPLLFACLGSTTCKLEMIGDHLQLQPSVMSKFDFERINKINISMFERLIRAPAGFEVPSSVLSLQRRMRKNIADLTREFYTDITVIEDHEVCRTKTIQTSQAPSVRPWYVPATIDKVKLSPSCGREIPGVGPHLFFWTHGGREENAHVGLSRINNHEANMACHLAKYLTDCGVPANAIAILTPYKGQLMHIRKILMSKQFGMSKLGRDKRYEPTCTLSTVDRFQGDEADIVIVSLVIDGKSRTPFVKLQNRMIVLLSRARIGMYVLGNIDYFTNAATPAHWQATLDKLSQPARSDNLQSVDKVCPPFDQARLGAVLPLCCPLHRKSVHCVRDPKQLTLSFCDVVCSYRLGCSHECGKRCHWATLNDHTTKCAVQVDSPCVQHPRKLKCAEVCQTPIRNDIVEALRAYRCDVLVDLQLPCTHTQRIVCALEVDIHEKTVQWPKCKENSITPFVYPDCKHELSCKCDVYYEYQAGKIRPPNCSVQVEYVPPCGHTTTLKCYIHRGIVEGRNRHVCAQKVKRVLPRCGHDATIACSFASTLDSWSGTPCTTFGMVDEGTSYGPTDHPCIKMVTFRRHCGHEIQVQCSAAFNMALTKPPCLERVDFMNPECGHIYRTTCSDANRLQQRANQTPVPAIDSVLEDDRSTVYRNFGLNVPCTGSVTLRRKCGHEQNLPCHKARITREPCIEPTITKRPDCGHDVRLSCALMGALQKWQPWCDVSSDKRTKVDLLTSSGIMSMSLSAPSRPSQSSLQSALGSCQKSVLLRRDTTCGHESRISCDQAMKMLRGEDISPPCNQRTSKSLPCGHDVEVACCVDVSKYTCKESVAVSCWNATVCHQTVETSCSSANNGVPAKVCCQSRTTWICENGKHNYLVAVCSKGEPTVCPGCSYDELMVAIEQVRSICSAEQLNDVPWPPFGVSAAAMNIPGFGTRTVVNNPDKLEFYRRQLHVLERFRSWIEQDEDVWSRALFQPLYMPVFTVLNDAKSNKQSPILRIDLKDFASSATWNNIEAYPLVAENVGHMLPPGGKGKKTQQSRRVVFGILFSVGINTAPSDAPSSTKYCQKIAQWIETQQQELGFDSAFFPKRKNGQLSLGGTLRVWDPAPLFPTGEATVRSSQRGDIVNSLKGDFSTAIETQYDFPSIRFLVFRSRDVLPQTQEPVETSSVNSSLSAEDKKRCLQLLEALPFAWVHRIRLHFPWSGSSMLVGRTSLPESVENQMFDKVAFLRPLSESTGHGTTKKPTATTPFTGMNYLKSVIAKQPFEEGDLFTALELLEVRKSSTVDAEAKLEQYVNQPQECHPLVLLALARLVARSRVPLRVQSEEFIALFQTIYPEAAKRWLTAAEQKILADKTASGNVVQQAKDADETLMSVEERWEKLKSEQNCASTAMDELLKMVGLARVKRSAIIMFKSALVFQRMTQKQREKNAAPRNYCFVGNPGTGKTTVAKLFARILKDSGIRRNSNALLCRAQELKDNGADKFRDEIKKAMGGVVFVDEAYELEPSSDPKGKPIVAEILVAAEEHRHDLSMILAGYEDDMKQKLYAYNDGLRSRFTEVTFDDFDEADLRVIWNGLLKEREWNCDDKVSAIACRRLARGADRKGFGNARAVRQLFDQAVGEAMTREDFGVLELRAVDVIGERPSKNPKLHALVQELNAKTGWKRIKERVNELIDICDANYERELNGRETLSVVMNRLFLGNPGTGKTTCATLYGKLLKHLGFLSNGEVVKKTAGDFVGQYIGQSQTKTNEILKLSKGKVLIIDEAYNLNDSLYGEQVLNVLVEKVQGSDTDDIAVILIGYEDQMTEMLHTQNPGLARRFPIEYAFYFDDYDDYELLDIFSAACERKNVDCPLDVAEEVVKILSMQRRQANFGNAGAVEMLLKNAMANASKRPIHHGETQMVLQLEDIVNEVSKRANDDGEEPTKEPEDPLQILDKLYRMDNIAEELRRLRTRFQVAEEEGEELPEIGHFVFRGSPGTGKTTVARTMGKILHRMGLLGSDRVVETSGLNLTGEYLGQTKKKVEEQLGKARGAILFIDEAYELGKGHYGQEAMMTLVAAMTDRMYEGMVIIIAGYPADMDAMLNRNAGLKSRFTRFLEFPDWETNDCIAFIRSRSSQEKYALSEDAVDKLQDLFAVMRTLPGFGNGRDVDKVWKGMLECRALRVVGHPELERTITLADVEAASQHILAAREPPKAERLSRPTISGFARVQSDSATNDSSRLERATNTLNEQQEDPTTNLTVDGEVEPEEEEGTSDEVQRDPGVSDDVWEELERSKQAYKQMLQDIKDAEDQKKQEEARCKAEMYKAIQKKLRRLAKCPAGFEWRQVSGGWRCAGGSHYVSNETLEKSFMY